MRSVTSCFNSTLYGKTMGRFWPLWALYGVGWMFALPLRLLTRYFDYSRFGHGDTAPDTFLLELVRETPDALLAGVSVSCVFAVLAAMAVFGYLYNNRSACLMHALPLRRETLFLTSYAAGLSFLLLPQLVAAVFAAAVGLVLLPAAAWGAALSALGVWLLVQSATALFFFSFAAFCAMFTGHILALPAFYAILNVLVMGVVTLVTGLMEQFFYGYASNLGNSRWVEYCTPVYALTDACYWDGAALESALTVAAYAVAGLVIAGLALLVYRRRHVESAGDVVAIPVVRPVFRYGVAVCAGLAFGVGSAYFFGCNDRPLPLTAWVLFWTVAGYFAASMLLKKSFRVFKAWKGCAAVAGVMLLLCAGCYFDFFGVETRVPAAGDVASVTVHSDTGAPYDGARGHWENVSDPAQIEKFVAVHQAIVNERARAQRTNADFGQRDSTVYFRVEYTLNSGATLRRTYQSVPVFEEEQTVDGTATNAMRQLLNDRTLLAQSYGLNDFEGARLVEAYLSGVSYQSGTQKWNEEFLDGAAADLDGLWQAVRQDFAEETLGKRYLFENKEREENTFQTDLRLTFASERASARGEPLYDEFCVTLTPNAAHTLQWLTDNAGLGETMWLITQDNENFPAAE